MTQTVRETEKFRYGERDRKKRLRDIEREREYQVLREKSRK